MGKLWRVCGLLLGGLVLLVFTYLVFMSLALYTLESRYDALSAGLTVEETDRIMGGLFRARRIHWDDIPEIYTAHYVAKTGSEVRDYSFLGIRGQNIVVIYDEEGLSYLHIPIYE